MLRSSSMLAIVTAAVIAGAACKGAPRQRNVELGPASGSLTEARKFLEGRWTLESFEVYPSGKGAIPLKGTGTLVYDEFGNLSMDIRADQASTDILRTAGIEMTNNRISSEGRTVVDLQHKTLTYVVSGQPPAGGGPLALNRPRHWQVDGDLLTLTTKDASGNPLSVGRWRKAP